MSDSPAAPSERFVFTVRQLTRYIRTLLERDSGLSNVWVRGEVSNCVAHSSGHIYFTLKDEMSQIRCVAFSEHAQQLAYQPRNGARVVLHGAVSVFERAGQYQLYVSEVIADGVGSLHLRFEQLREKLLAEGLFDAVRKRPLPSLPRRIAVITSPDGAVFHDFCVIARRRWPGVRVELVPAAVSGAAAAPTIVRALERAAKLEEVEVIVLARGGGSLEELWPFNEEVVARAVARSPVPVVSAVGHETDFTIADFVADVRAPTPSAAAEMLTPDAAGLGALLSRLAERARRAATRAVERRRRELELVRGRRVLAAPAVLLAELRQRADEALRRIRAAADESLKRHTSRLGMLREQARALDPLQVLARGYCVMRLPPAGQVVRSVSQLAPGAQAEVVLGDGSAWCEVERLSTRESDALAAEGKGE